MKDSIFDISYGAAGEEQKKQERMEKVENIKKSIGNPYQKENFTGHAKMILMRQEAERIEKEREMTSSIFDQIRVKAEKLFGKESLGHILFFTNSVGSDIAYDLLFKIKLNATARELIEILRTNTIAVKNKIPECLERILEKKSNIESP